MTRKLGDLSCADCGKPMWIGKGTLPQGQARCRPCRHAAALARLDAAPTECRCTTALTRAQRIAGGRFCSRRCAYLEYVGSEHRDKRDYKRRRELGGLRFNDVPRTCEGWPTSTEPSVPTDRWVLGPPRLIFVTCRHYDDGRVEIRCPSCMTGAEHVSATEAWCGNCAVAVYVYPPEPRRVKPKPQPVQTAAKECPVCGELHTRPIYCSPRCCIVASERRRAERNRKPPRSACPQGHPYTDDNRRVRTRIRDGVARTESECRICNRIAEQRKAARRRARTQGVGDYPP